MEKSLKKDIIINRLPVVIYFILIFAALMVIISAVAPMSNHEPKTTDTYSDFSTGWLNCEESEASLDHLSGSNFFNIFRYVCYCFITSFCSFFRIGFTITAD